MVKLTPRQEKIAQYLQRQRHALLASFHAVKSAIAYKCAQFFELTVLQRIGTITHSPEQSALLRQCKTGGALHDEIRLPRTLGGTTPITVEQPYRTTCGTTAARQKTRMNCAPWSRRTDNVSPWASKYLGR
jgi:hypothetical protein